MWSVGDHGSQEALDSQELESRWLLVSQCGCWDTNSGLVERKQALLMSLQPCFKFLIRYGVKCSHFFYTVVPT